MVFSILSSGQLRRPSRGIAARRSKVSWIPINLSFIFYYLLLRSVAYHASAANWTMTLRINICSATTTTTTTTLDDIRSCIYFMHLHNTAGVTVRVNRFSKYLENKRVPCLTLFRNYDRFSASIILLINSVWYILNRGNIVSIDSRIPMWSKHVQRENNCSTKLRSHRIYFCMPPSAISVHRDTNCINSPWLLLYFISIATRRRRTVLNNIF